MAIKLSTWDNFGALKCQNQENGTAMAFKAKNARKIRNIFVSLFIVYFLVQLDMPTYIKLLYSVCLRIAYGKVVKFDPRGRCASRKFLIIGKKIETLNRGGDLDKNFLLSRVSRQELSYLSKRIIWPIICRGSSRKFLVIIVKGDWNYNRHGVFTKIFRYRQRWLKL